MLLERGYFLNVSRQRLFSKNICLPISQNRMAQPANLHFDSGHQNFKNLMSLFQYKVCIGNSGLAKYAHNGHMGICEKIWSSGVSPKRASKMQLRDVDLRSVGPSVQKLWPTTFFAKKMPCILHGAEKKISNVISSQVSGRAQLPGVFIYLVDHFSKYFISGGDTCTICSHPNIQQADWKQLGMDDNVYF